MTTTHQYSGDVTLSGDEQTPVAVRNPENVYVQRDAVDGDLKIVDAEYVFTGTPAGGEAAVESTGTEAENGAVGTEFAGTLEDAYVESGAVDGDVVVSGAEDVFVAHGAVSGELQILGDEQRFRDDSGHPAHELRAYDEAVMGWQRSLTVENPARGVAVAGGRNSLTVEDPTEAELYVLGWNNEVRVEGRPASVTLHLIGSHNTVKTGPYVDLTVGSESGIENEFVREDVPVEDVVQTTKDEAYSRAFFGRHRVTYQEPAPDQAFCPGCGADADAVVTRHLDEAFFLFGHPVYSYDGGATSHECEECSKHVQPETQLTESERKEIFQ